MFFIITLLTGGENRDAGQGASTSAGQGVGANALPNELSDLHGGIHQGMTIDQRMKLFTTDRIPDKFVESFRWTYYNAK